MLTKKHVLNFFFGGEEWRGGEHTLMGVGNYEDTLIEGWRGRVEERGGREVEERGRGEGGGEGWRGGVEERWRRGVEGRVEGRAGGKGWRREVEERGRGEGGGEGWRGGVEERGGGEGWRRKEWGGGQSLLTIKLI